MFGVHLIVERGGQARINWRMLAVLAFVLGWCASFAFLGIVYAYDLDRNLFRIFFPALLVIGSALGIPLRAFLRRRRSPASAA